MIKDNQRKHSEDALSESQDQSGNLFPKSSIIDLENCLEMLKEYYNKDLHSFELTNYCYRCHNQEFVSAYTKFKNENHPELQEPKISTIYQNKSFVDLEELSKRIKKQPFQIPEPFIAPVPKNFKNILNQLFQKNGYIPNLERFLIYYPTYLERHMLVYSILFESDRIDCKIAYFLGIIAAAELGSVYIMARMIKKFLKQGGLISWIIDAKYPIKYKPIFQINRMMARAPWDVTPQMIQDILDNNNGSHWTKSQLAIYIQVLAFTHQISTISLSIGLLPEDPSPLSILNLSKILALKNFYDKKVISPVQPTQKLASVIPIIKETEQSQNSNLQQKQQAKNEAKPGSGEAKSLLKKQRKVQNTDNYMKQIANQLTSQQLYKDINKLVQPLLPPFYLFQDRKYLKGKVVDYSDFNFKFMAYPILYTLSDGVAAKFQSLIDYSEMMTRNNFGSENINNTKQFRKAVRYYSQNLCFYTHHQYDFKNNVSLYLTMALKFYIRLITLSPLHINKQVIQFTNHQCGEQIQCFDLGHLAVIVANTKMSLELTMAILAFQM